MPKKIIWQVLGDGKETSLYHAVQPSIQTAVVNLKLL
jgi:hypothetical protein